MPTEPAFPRLTASAAAAMVVWAAALPAVAEESIEWAIMVRPPFMIAKTAEPPRTPADLGDGENDRAMAHIIQRLPGYRHSFRVTNLQRLWHGIGQGENLCFVGSQKTKDRLAVAVFTPYRLVPPQVLVVHRNSLSAIVGTDKSISLAQVLSQHASEGRVEDKRSYGPQIDPLLARYPVRRELVPNVGALATPLAAGLFGFSIEYPQTIQYLTESGSIANSLETVEIKEASDWPESFVACTRNAWGEKAIRDIDGAIRKESATREYRQDVNRWTPKRLVRNREEQLQSYFDDRAKGGARVE